MYFVFRHCKHTAWEVFQQLCDRSVRTFEIFERSEIVNAKNIVAIVLAVFILGGFVFLQLRNRKR